MAFHFHKASITPQKGYVLLSLMLIIGSLGLYLTYQLSVKTIKTQSWEIQKTATEMGYWLDIEHNYIQDNDTVTPSSISLALLQQQYFLPYGLAEKNTFSLSTPVSEFLCSALSGINTADGTLSLSGTSVTTTCTNPSCTLNNLYYSCGTTPARAQYYTNTNYINLTSAAVGLGLIVRTPKTAATQSLPDNSVARNLIALLPTSNANTYTTSSAQVNGIGIGSYIIPTTSTTIVANNSYNKIIDMGLVQTSKPNSPDGDCTGWKNGTKSGSGYLQGDNKKSKYDYEPPTCIRITPANHLNCKSFDVLYGMYRAHTDANAFNSGLTGYDIRKTVVRKNGSYIDVYLTLDSENRGANSGYQATRKDHEDNWLIYLVRCRQP